MPSSSSPSGRAVDPGFALAGDAALVAEVCRRLDGLPLAIELAAARAGVLRPGDLLARLERALPVLGEAPRGAPARHRTLHAAIAWSHDLLSPAERDLFERLSVFAGGFSLEAAAAIARAPTGDDGVLDAVAALLDKSLLRRQDATPTRVRYAMLETVRAFALARLRSRGAAGEAEARAAHAACFLELAEAAEPALTGPDQAAWFCRLADDHANVLAALDWLAGQGDGDRARRLASALWWFWLVRGHLTEGRARLEAALALPGGDDGVRAKALAAAGNVAAWQGDYRQAAAWAEEALAIRRARMDERGLAQGLCAAANAAINLEDYDRAAAHAAEAETIAHAVRDPRLAADARNLLGVVAAGRRDYAAAGVAFGIALRASEALGDAAREARIRGNVALAALLAGDLATAEAQFRRAIAMDRESGSERGIGFCLRGFAGLAAARGDDDDAARLFGAAEAMYERIGEAARPVIVRAVAPIVRGAHARLGEAAFLAAWAAGRALTVDEAVELALEARATIDDAARPTPAT